GIRDFHVTGVQTCALPIFVSIIPVDSLDEAIEVVNGVQYGLCAAIFTQNVNNAFRAMQDIYTGILYVNAGTTGAEIHLPFGGTRSEERRVGKECRSRCPQC